MAGRKDAPSHWTPLMTIATVGPPLLFAVVATVTPGGATTLATASGTQFGFRRSVPLMAGIALALASLAAAASLGLANVLLAVPALQLAAKTAGTVYLLWLARGIARSGRPKDAALLAPTSLLGGFVLLWLNPKGWAMTLSAAAAFAESAGGRLHLAVLLTAVFGVAAAVSLSLWCCAGLMFSRLLRTAAQWRVLNVSLAVLLVVSIAPMWLGQ